MQEDFDFTGVFFVFFFKERDAAVLAAKSKCSRAGVRWKVAGGNGGTQGYLSAPACRWQRCLAIVFK